MEQNLESDIPIYKICHIRSPDIIRHTEDPALSSALTPEYNVIYVFYGNVEFLTYEQQVVNLNELFIKEPNHPLFKKIFSECELLIIQQNDIKVVFLPERIYADDSIETIKKKFLYLTRDEVGLSYAELYLFCKQTKRITTQMAYDQITSNGRLEMTSVRVQNYLLNIDNYSKDENARPPDCFSKHREEPEYMKLGEPTSENYTYTNIANLKLEEKHRIINVALGQELNIASSYGYPYAVNPFDALNADPFLEIHAGEIVNTSNKMVLIDYGLFIDNTIYLVSAEDALTYAKETSLAAITQETSRLQQTSDGGGAAAVVEPAPSARFGKPIYESYMVSLYFPYLFAFRDNRPRTSLEQGSAEASGEVDLSTIHSHNTLMLHRPSLFEADKRILNDKFMRQTANIKLLYDIYENQTEPLNYLDSGIRGVELMIHPETPYNQSLDAIFKLIHCSEYIPYIKHNPGKKRDNIYKLHISSISRSGRKIPFLHKGDIFRLIKTTARKKSVAILSNFKYKNNDAPDHKATNLPIQMLCEFYPNGSIYIKLIVKFSFTTTEIEEIIMAGVNPILRILKEHVEQGGFQMNLFTHLHDRQIELINLEYFAQLPITRNIEIKQMIKCISSAFNEVEGSLKKGIVLRYKRVSNYNEMSSQDAYIIEMMNKRHNDRDIIDGLKDNYSLTDHDARAKLSAFLSSLQTQQFSRFRGGNIRIKNNPGFLTKITKGAYNNIITVEITNINNILYLTSLHAYIDSIIRIYQNPSTTNVPYEKIVELCSNKAFAPPSAKKSTLLSNPSPVSGAAADAAPVDDSPMSSSSVVSFVSDMRPKAVGDIVQSDKEESIDLMEEIVHVIKKSESSASAGGVAASIKEPVFGFEMERPKEEEIDLFDLLQDENDDDDDGGGDSAPTSAQGGGGGRSGGVGGGGGSAAVGQSEQDEPEEDLSDITGMELANPNPFSKRIQERDPIIHLNEDVGKFNAYSRSCPWNVRRQPVILTDDEKARIDREHPGSYSQSITYGSDTSKQYHYICPRYWSLKHNTSLTEEEVKSGKYGSVIPHDAKKVPSGATIFEFTDKKYHIDEKGNYKQHYPGFLKKDAHPKGLCVPCCFSQWDKPAQTARRAECESKKFEKVRMLTPKPPIMASDDVMSSAQSDADVNTSEPLSYAVLGGTEAEAGGASATVPHATGGLIGLSSQEPVKFNEIKDDRILSSDKFPLENNRMGYLPVQLQKFLFTDNRNCQISIMNASIKKDTPCFIRRGVETNDHQSFVSVIAYYYKDSLAKEKPTVTVLNVSKMAADSQQPSQAVAGGGVAGGGASSLITASLEPMQINPGMKADDLVKMVTDNIQKNSRTLSKRSDKHSFAGSLATASAASAAAAPITPIAQEPAVEDLSDDDNELVMTPRNPSTTMAGTPRVLGLNATTKSLVANDKGNIPTIREMRSIIIQSLDIDMFITLQNGTLVDSFYNPNKEVLEPDMVRKYSASVISRTLPKPTFIRICNAYENFIAYLSDDTSLIDHTYLWDIVSRPNERLFKQGNNIILLHIPDDDITNNVQVICPTNAYSGETFDINRPTIIIMKRDVYYEPIFIFTSSSNGKTSFRCRFSMKSKTLMPKIKHIIERIRDLYFSYCRLHASQPRVFKYKMNLPAQVIAKIVKDAGFKINAQVMNFNGKVIGLQISQAISKLVRIDPNTVARKYYERKSWKGVIPTAISAPLTASYINSGPSAPLPPGIAGGIAADTGNIGGTGIEDTKRPPPMVMMNEDELWTMSYHQTLEFLREVERHVKKTTKKQLYCLPKAKVVEEGFIVGVITETNQFIQVNVEKDIQLNQNDGLETITESKHLIADEIVATTPKNEMADKTRERYVRNIRLETNFYNVFRNTARNVLNRPENKAVKDEIEKIIGSAFVIYTNKLSQVIAHMKKILSKHISFIRYKKNTLKMVGEISGCITSDDNTCGRKSYCLKEYGGLCKLLLPQRNLMFPDIDNQIAYFGKLADEMIRYERVKLFMFEPTKYLSFQDIKYNLRENEIILLETFITQEYFENMEPADANPYIHQTNFYTVAPSNAGNQNIQHYDPVYQQEYVDRYLEIETGAKRGSAPAVEKEPVSEIGGSGDGAEVAPISADAFHINEINHVLDFCQEVSKRRITVTLRNMFFPKINTFEIMFSNESKECSFDIILTILRSVAQSASKCPSGHSCIRKSAAFSMQEETGICSKCRTTIGHDETDFACRQCNYFICDNCRVQHVDEFAGMTVTRIKDILVTEYAKLAALGLDKKLTMIINGYGMKQYADIINEGRATLSQFIQSENYFLTNIDLWLLALYFKIPMVFVSQTELSENGKKYMVLFGDEMTESYFFIQPFQVTQDVPSRFGLIEIKDSRNMSFLKIPLSYVSPELQENIRVDDDTRISLEEYIRTYKLGNMKHKKRVFKMMKKSEGSANAEPADKNDAQEVEAE